jgi:hypothetical protein
MTQQHPADPRQNKRRERDLFQEAGIAPTQASGRDLFQEAGIRYVPEHEVTGQRVYLSEREVFGQGGAAGTIDEFLASRDTSPRTAGSSRASPEAVNWGDFTPVDTPRQGSVNWDDFTPVESPPGTIDAFLRGAPSKRTWGEAAKDTVVQLAEGVNTIAGAVPNLVAPESRTAQLFRDNAEYWRDRQSDALKGRIARADQAIDAAGDDGVMAQIAEAAGQYFSDPALAARFVVTNLPSMIPGLAVTKLTHAATLAERKEPGYQEQVKEIDARIGEAMTKLNRAVAQARKERAQ